MKKISTILLLLMLCSLADAQVVNRFRDSSWFAKGVRFDSTVQIKNVRSSATTADTSVLVVNSNGTVKKINKSEFASSIVGVTSGGLADSLSDIRKYVDSLVF